MAVGSNTVTLNSANTVVLGSLPQIAGGRLVAQNKILPENGDKIVTTDVPEPSTAELLPNS